MPRSPPTQRSFTSMHTQKKSKSLRLNGPPSRLFPPNFDGKHRPLPQKRSTLLMACTSSFRWSTPFWWHPRSSALSMLHVAGGVVILPPRGRGVNRLPCFPFPIYTLCLSLSLTRADNQPIHLVSYLQGQAHAGKPKPGRSRIALLSTWTTGECGWGWGRGAFRLGLVAGLALFSIPSDLTIYEPTHRRIHCQYETSQGQRQSWRRDDRAP